MSVCTVSLHHHLRDMFKDGVVLERDHHPLDQRDLMVDLALQECMQEVHTDTTPTTKDHPTLPIRRGLLLQDSTT